MLKLLKISAIIDSPPPIQGGECSYHLLKDFVITKSSFIFNGELKAPVGSKYGHIFFVSNGTLSILEVFKQGELNELGNTHAETFEYNVADYDLHYGNFHIISYVIANDVLISRLYYVSITRDVNFAEGYAKLFPVVSGTPPIHISGYAIGYSDTHSNTDNIPDPVFYPINPLETFVEGSYELMKLPASPHFLHTAEMFVEGYYEVYPIPNPQVEKFDKMFVEGYSNTHENTEIPDPTYNNLSPLETYSEGYGFLFPLVNPLIARFENIFAEGYSDTHNNINKIVGDYFSHVMYHSIDPLFPTGGVNRGITFDSYYGGKTPPQYVDFNDKTWELTSYEMSLFVVKLISGNLHASDINEDNIITTIHTGIKINHDKEHLFQRFKLIGFPFSSDNNSYLVSLEPAMLGRYKNVDNHSNTVSFRYYNETPVNYLFIVPSN